jgi:hypothetical protein
MESAAVGAIASVAVSYATIGIAVAAAFLTLGIGRVVPSARTSYAFRALLIPGAILLWPFVLRRWAILRQQPLHGTP